MPLIRNVIRRLFTRTTDPGGATEGSVYWDSDDDVLKVHDGSTFQAVASITGGITASSLTANTLPKYNGTALANSRITDDETEIKIQAPDGTVGIGDPDQVSGSTRISVNDGAQTVQVGASDIQLESANGPTLRLYDGLAFYGGSIDLNSGGGTTNIGDSAAENNGTQIVVDDSARTIDLNATNGVKINGVKRYVAIITQSGTSAPTATVLENSLGGTVVWTRDDVGLYIGTLSGAFVSNKTVVLVSSSLGASQVSKTTNTIELTFASDDMIIDIEVSVYP